MIRTQAQTRFSGINKACIAGALLERTTGTLLGSITRAALRSIAGAPMGGIADASLGGIAGASLGGILGTALERTGLFSVPNVAIGPMQFSVGLKCSCIE